MVIITCAGLGTRFKGFIDYPKQLLKLKNGKTIIESIIENVREFDDHIVIVANKDNYKYFEFLQLPIYLVDKLLGSAYSASCAISNQNERLKDPSLYSFVITDGEKVIKTIEKESGGDYGIIGIYGFKNTQEYKQAVNEMILKTKPKEYTNALVYNFLTDNTYLQTFDYKILGTPKQYVEYTNS